MAKERNMVSEPRRDPPDNEPGPYRALRINTGEEKDGLSLTQAADFSGSPRHVIKRNIEKQGSHFNRGERVTIFPGKDYAFRK